MVRVITQETYDEVVKENIDEFGMSPADAIQEAIAQFEAQGVNLSNIIKDLSLGTGDNHEVATTIEKLKTLTDDDKSDEKQILDALEILKSECSKDLARRMRAGKEGAYNLLMDLLQTKQSKFQTELSERDKKFIVCVLETLVALMETQPDLLDNRGISLIKDVFDNIENEDILTLTLQWSSACCYKHEMNRQKLFAKNITENLKMLLKITSNKKLLSETLQVIRKLTLDDDIRVEFGKAHEHAWELGKQLLEPLTNLLKENSKPPLVSELMLTIAALLVRNELCALVAPHTGALLAVLADNFDNSAVAHHAAKLITALAGNDDVKRELVKKGIAPIIVSLLERHSSNAKTSSSLLKCVAAVSLREAAHGRALLDAAAADVALRCMAAHQHDASVQKNACWALRNMVARHREHNGRLRELGAEQLLNAAHDKFAQQFGFDIKSALRDLECDVRLDEQWTGSGQQIAAD